MIWPFKRKTLESVVCQEKKVTVCGIKFKIRKINPIDYFNGSKSVIQFYDTYKQPDVNDPGFANNLSKVKDHFADVILAGVVEPKLSRKKGEDGIPIENLFTDWGLAGDLYGAIMEYTYGKKKLKTFTSLVKSL